jgi:hypothetical protein
LTIDNLVICSKSTWEPPIRREHALAQLAANDGLAVTFVERPSDVRAITSPRTASVWWRDFVSGTPPLVPRSKVFVRARAGLVPAHRGRFPQSIDNRLLTRELERVPVGAGTALLATTPWHWQSVRDSSAGRRIFDCADDWATLMPSRRIDFLRIYNQIAHEADAISVASENLASLFEGRDVAVVRNGVSSEMLSEPVQAPPGRPRAVYAGTLSPRFDAALVARFLNYREEWRIDLYGQCQYPRQRELPDDELRGLLTDFDGRAAWHGAVPRQALTGAIDAGQVCVLPHQRSVPTALAGKSTSGGLSPPGWRGDAMKLYDYAARGRPIVSTKWEDNLLEVGPPHSYVTDTHDDFCEAVIAAADEPAHFGADRRAWAEQNRWGRRWEMWRRLIRGDA